MITPKKQQKSTLSLFSSSVLTGLSQAIIALLLILALPAFASSKANTQSLTLDNGLQVIVREDHRSPVVFSSVWYKVGGSYEQSGTTGLSHALEHMMFRGTPRFPEERFNELVAKAGGQQNAMTSRDYTMYYQVLPKNQLALSFELEADRMHNLSLSKKDFAKEIAVVKEERRMRIEDNPAALAWEQLNAVAHLNHPDHNPVIGWMSDLQQMQQADLKAWYQTWYQPNNAVVVVVGDVKAEDVFTLAKKYFGPLKSTPVATLKQVHDAPSYGKKTLTVVKEGTVPKLFLSYPAPSIATAEQSWQPYALLVLAYVLDGGDSSRLSRDLVRKGQALSANAGYDPFRRVSSTFIVTATPMSKQSLEQLDKVIQTEITAIQNKPVSAKELERAKAQLLAQLVYSEDSLFSQATDLGQWLMMGKPWQGSQQLKQAVESVTSEQVQQVAQQYLDNNKVTAAKLTANSMTKAGAI